MLLNIILIIVIVSIFLNIFINYKEPYTETTTSEYITKYFDNISLVAPSCSNSTYTYDNCINSDFKRNNINNIRQIVNNRILNTNNLF